MTEGPGRDRNVRCVGIAGLGLIGTSMGLALRRSKTEFRRIGFDPDANAREQALQRGAVDEVCSALAGVAGEADILVLAAPPRTVRDMAQEVARLLRPGAVVTDVCSVKRPIVSRYEEVLRDRAQFVGGHPIAGREGRGGGAADASLFQGAAYVLTPTENTSSAALDQIEELVRALGAQPIRMGPNEHDHAVAAVSHLPQLIASTLMLAVGRQQAPQASAGDLLSLAGGGLRDTTRIAASPEELWREILLSNADYVLEQLDRFESALAAFRASLEAGDGQGLMELLGEAARRRRAQGFPFAPGNPHQGKESVG